MGEYVTNKKEMMLSSLKDIWQRHCPCGVSPRRQVQGRRLK